MPIEKLMSGNGPLEDVNEAFDQLDREAVIMSTIVCRITRGTPSLTKGTCRSMAAWGR